jgi:hypothetical protein
MNVHLYFLVLLARALQRSQNLDLALPAEGLQRSARLKRVANMDPHGCSPYLSHQITCYTACDCIVVVDTQHYKWYAALAGRLHSDSRD